MSFKFLGSNGDDSGSGKENEVWRAKMIPQSMVVELAVDANVSQLHKNNQSNKYHQKSNLGAIPKDKQAQLNSFIQTNISMKENDKACGSESAEKPPLATNNKSNSNHSSPLQPRRGTYFIPIPIPFCYYHFLNWFLIYIFVSIYLPYSCYKKSRCQKQYSKWLHDA